MSDELTPEERDALNSLPRERMPSAGLEDRVVGAMRAQGALSPAPRARVIRLTTPRIATLVAAGIALMIGAYSIGVQRGAFRPEVRETLEPRTAERATTDETRPAIGLNRSTQPEAGIAMQSRPEPETKQETAPEKLEWKLKETPKRNDVPQPAERTRVVESVADQPATASEPAPAPAQQFTRELDATMAKKSLQAAPQVPPATDLRAMEAPVTTREYALGSQRLTIDAPGAVRIETDEPEQVLTIHSPDGLVRVRLPRVTALSMQPGKDQLVPIGLTTRTVELGGHEFLVDAPAAVRVERDAEGRTLLIHTASGIIRARLAE